MARLPTYQSQENPEANNPLFQQSDNTGGASLAILGKTAGQVGSNLMDIAETHVHLKKHLEAMQRHQENVINHLANAKIAQMETLEVNQKTSQLHTDWNDRLIEYQQNPELATMENANKEYNDYVTKMLGDSKSDNIRNELALNAASYKINFVNNVYTIQSQEQLRQFGATFDQMMSNAEDSIFATKSMTEMQTQKDLMTKTINDAERTGQIKNPEIIQGLHDKVDLLGISWAESVMPKNPELVKRAIDDGMLPGVNAHQKSVLIEKADEVIKTKDNQMKVLLHDALESDITQRMTTGEGRSLDLNLYEAKYGADARKIAEQRLNNATQVHSAISSAAGASGEKLLEIAESYKPKANPDSSDYGRQYQLYADVQKVVTQAMDDRAHNAFNYFATHPAVKDLDLRSLGLESPESRKQLTDAVLELQKGDKALPAYQYQVMPTGEAEQFIENFNKLTEVGSKGDGGGVRDMLANFSKQYDTNLHIALNQLNETKGGDKVTPKLNALMWHVNNPSTFRLVLDAIRKDPSEEIKRFPSEKEYKNFLADAKIDPNMLNYQSSIFSANNSASAAKLVGGINESYTAFARDWVLNGGKIKDASALFFSPYSWGTVNGASYARPNVYTDDTGKQHIMSEDQIRLSNNYLTWFPLRLDPSTVEPKSILNTVSYFNTDQLTKDTANALRSNTFWSTTEDETGVYMFTKGSLAGAPKQVFYKDGRPVRVNFVDTMVSVPEVPFGAEPHPYSSETGDSDLQRLANFLLNSH